MSQPTESPVAAAVRALRDFLGTDTYAWSEDDDQTVRSALAMWARYPTLTPEQVGQVVSAYLSGAVVDSCVTCGEPIEKVREADDWLPYWRHLDPTRLHGLLPTRPARTGEAVYERTEEVGSANLAEPTGGFRVGKDVDPDDLPGGAL